MVQKSTMCRYDIKEGMNDFIYQLDATIFSPFSYDIFISLAELFTGFFHQFFGLFIYFFYI